MIRKKGAEPTTPWIGADGEIRWKVPRESKRLTYSTPCIFTDPKGKPELIFTNWWLGFTSLEPRTGKKLWELSVFGRPHSERAISSPIVAGNLVLGVCGFDPRQTSRGHPSGLRVRRWESQGDLETREHHAPHPLPAPLRQPALPVGGQWRHYLCPPRNRETSLESPGRRSQDTFFGSPVRAGKSIFCVSAFGQVVAIEDADEFKQLGVTNLNQVCRSTPALANGDLYLRTGDHLICIKGV